MTRPLFVILLWLFALPAAAVPDATVLDPAVVKKLAAEDSDARIAAIQQLGSQPGAASLLQAMADDELLVSGDTVFVLDGERALDAASGAEIKPVPETYESVSVNSRVRSHLSGVLAALRLQDADRGVRLAAAQSLQGSADAELMPVLAQAMAREADAEIKAVLQLAHAQASLASPRVSDRLAAVVALADSTSPATRGLLLPLVKPGNEPDARVRAAAAKAVKAIESRLALGEMLGQVFTGLSLGSILLLAALGLAITYGVMGVINMAHGELLMVGAYATYLVQTVFRTYLPQYLDWYLLAAIPVAFAAAALVGMLLERTVIRRLYGRPLETLLATWGLSLMLIQAARVIFGAQNVEVANPVWMSGGIELMAGLVLPWNRIVIIGFALFVLALMWALMQKTRLGLFVRAVTQNRAMAGCVGVPTGRIDMLAFGLGAGIAGLGGVALSQIANVGPDMGQGYIVDSFLVVVLGGVGQLAGAAWAALGLGVVTKFLEGWSGAVLAKIMVLIIVIVFIQKRPQGLFALKGRFVEN
ncbi:MAG TPA: urea ABC transporter permease subunit UrtB [Thiobacillus sp.]|nr:MAG: urea ABC transporter permease subunit UrtB [Hydrogenophilales bacterium 28-61-11]OYZ56817.1 MAG: urea ABC transporter permease subunit UrtB [Hydrogenophilales bacterium 16-61-112]OZA44566.1 MAG: urea ABC transporter permease subunit UrtB [Hydrogenophilales bacterium 17-61-76]HQT32227.1 urea ABC transporter permease subunit UrtB [Thiobacillus sp.]HQT71788.1 urea ABC transporter permease subunit UrtB [Thiobacillus sp.]